MNAAPVGVVKRRGQTPSGAAGAAAAVGFAVATAAGFAAGVVCPGVAARTVSQAAPGSPAGERSRAHSMTSALRRRVVCWLGLMMVLLLQK